MPTTSYVDKASMLVEDLIHKIKHPVPASAFHNVGNSSTAAICTLETFFTAKPPSDPPPRVAILKPAPAPPSVQALAKSKNTLHFPTLVVSKRFAYPFPLPDKPLFHDPAIHSTNIIPSTAARQTLQSNYV